MYTFKVIIIQDEQGGYTATIPTLEYCMSRGATVDEALDNIQEAMEGVIETMQNRGIPIPKEQRFIEASLQYPRTTYNTVLKNKQESPATVIRTSLVTAA